MAIPKGVYRLGPKGASKSVKDIAAYCVDFSRPAPTKGINYNNLLDGSASVIFEGTNQIISLKEAITSGKVSIEGAQWASIDDFIDYFRKSPEYLTLTDEEKASAELFELLPMEQALRDNPSLLAEIPNWTQLKIVNNSTSPIRIEAASNMQFGTPSEKIARGGLKDFDFKGGKYGEADIQERAWIQQTKDDYNQLKLIGEYEGEIPKDQDILNEAKSTFRKFQEKNSIKVTGELDEITEQKIIEIKNKLLDDYNMLNQNPNNLTELSEVIGEYQSRNGLIVDKNMNSETVQKIAELKKELTNQLESTIHGVEGKNIIEQINTYKGIKKLKNQQSVADVEFTNALNSDLNYYVYVNGNYKPFLKSNISISNTEGKEIKNLKTIRYHSESNVHLILDDDINKSIETLNKSLDWNYDLNEITIFPITKNADTRNLLKDKFGKNWIKSNLKSEKKVAKKLRKSKRKTVLIVGHIENGHFVEGDFKISLDALNDYAKEYNLNIFHLGCSTAEVTGTGTMASINTYKTVDALISSVKEHNNFKEFFLDFSRKGIGADNLPVDLLVDGNTFSDKRYTKFKLYQKGGIAGMATLGGGVLLYYLISDDDDETENNE